MCGLAGIVLTSPGNAEELAPTVKAMCDAQFHRGPDDGGIKAIGRVCLGSRRLSIIDLSPAGHMPMSDAQGRWWIAYNGEVFNFAAIREELVQLGHEFHSHTDTEVVLHAYMQWGSDCLERLVGMFAFAIYDSHTHRLDLVRDRYGKKPLYFMRNGESVAFASELKALMLVNGAPRIDQQSLCEWFLYRNIDVLTTHTLVEEIETVLPGQVVTIDDSGIHAREYYSARSHVNEGEFRRYFNAKPATVIDEIATGLEEAIRLRLISDVPVGTLLSGGLDSSLLTAMAARHTQSLTAFHVSVEGFPNLDERRFAEEVAARHHVPFVPMSLNGALFRRSLAQVTYLSDLPLTHANSVAYYLISKVAREHGTIVLLSGEGADELFGGYSWNYRRRRRLLMLKPWLKRLPETVQSSLALIVYAQAGLPVQGRRFRELLPPAIDFIDRYARLDWQERCEEAYSFISRASSRAVLGSMLADLGDFLTPLLRRLDRTSMGASVECRVPFLDHRLVHRAINLPLDYKVGTFADKWVVKQIAARYLSRKLVFRKKAGFPLPLDDYIAPLARPEFFRNGFCENAVGISARAMNRIISSWRRQVYGFFGLVSLEIWGRIFFMGESVDEVSDLIAACEHRADAASLTK